MPLINTMQYHTKITYYTIPCNIIQYIVVNEKQHYSIAVQCIALRYDIIWPIFTAWYVFSCDQPAVRTLLSVCPSVRPSVCPSSSSSVRHTFLTIFLSYLPEISGVITIERRDVHAKRQGQRSKVKVTEVMTPFSCFRTEIPVWIHIWRWNDAQSLLLLRRGALLFFKVFCQISRSHG